MNIRTKKPSFPDIQALLKMPYFYIHKSARCVRSGLRGEHQLVCAVYSCSYAPRRPDLMHRADLTRVFNTAKQGV